MRVDDYVIILFNSQGGLQRKAGFTGKDIQRTNVFIRPHS